MSATMAGADPFNGSLNVFRARRTDRIKIVLWDGTGLCLHAKRLERRRSAGRERMNAINGVPLGLRGELLWTSESCTFDEWQLTATG